MSKPKLLQGAVVAAALAIAATIALTALAPLLGTASAARLVVPGITLAYLVYLLRTSKERTGRPTVLLLWSASAVAAWWIEPSLPAYLLLHAGAIWLIRSLYFHSGLLPALADLALSVFSVAAFAWAASRTGSVFLATWCLFLLQAFYACIPVKVKRGSHEPPVDNSAFERARRQADAALGQLFRH